MFRRGCSLLEIGFGYTRHRDVVYFFTYIFISHRRTLLEKDARWLNSHQNEIQSNGNNDSVLEHMYFKE
jgi:hypothetical protein